MDIRKVLAPLFARALPCVPAGCGPHAYLKDHFRAGVQCVEEQDVGGETAAVLRQYVGGRYVDERIQQKEVE